MSRALSERSVPTSCIFKESWSLSTAENARFVGYLLEGELDLFIDGTTYRMKAGDSFFFKAHLTNGYRNTGTVVARILWVNTPQIH